MTFEILAVRSEQDSIILRWKGEDGIYRVQRDGQTMYEGYSMIFVDKQAVRGEKHTYKIRNDHEVIVVQTSLFAFEKDEGNLLRDVVLTTIVSKDQVVLSWEAIPFVASYEVFRNGQFLCKVSATYVIDQSISVTNSYEYTIYAERPIVMSDEKLNYSKAIASKAVAIFQPLKAKIHPTSDRFIMTKKIAVIENILAKEQTSSSINSWQLRYTTFLADKWVKNPNWLSFNHYFKGDHRDFQSDGKTFRTRVDLALHFCEKNAPLSMTKSVSSSEAYSYRKKFRAKATASLEDVDVQRFSENYFRLRHSVGNPLTPAPNINYEVVVEIEKNGNFDISGQHDPAPHHEVYVQTDNRGWMPIHQAKSKGLAYMSEMVVNEYWRYSYFQASE